MTQSIWAALALGFKVIWSANRSQERLLCKRVIPSAVFLFSSAYGIIRPPGSAAIFGDRAQALARPLSKLPFCLRRSTQADGFSVGKHRFVDHAGMS